MVTTTADLSVVQMSETEILITYFTDQSDAYEGAFNFDAVMENLPSSVRGVASAYYFMNGDGVKINIKPVNERQPALWS